MELSLLLAEQIAALFLMGVIGFGIVKAGILRTEDSQVLSKVCVYVCAPCMTVKAFQIECTPDKVKGLLLAVAAVIILHVVYIGGARLLRKPLGLNSIERASIIYSNAGNLIIPLVLAIFGEEWVFYTCAYTSVQLILMWTHGKALVCQSEKFSLKKILGNMNLIAIAIGVLLFAANIRLPEIVGTVLGGMGTMLGPISMMVIGMLIGDVDLRQVFCRKRIYLICFLRLIVCPVVSILLIKVLGLGAMHPDAHQILLIVVLAGASCVAATITQMAQVFGGDAEYASVINVMSVIFCVITMPLMVLVYESIF